VVVASRRNIAPHGLHGGADGAPGRQWVERADGSITPMPGHSAKAELEPGDVLVVETPGGGGWGRP
jgi:5-oxoprolinase (ATP-hydrolysing)